MSTTSTKLFSPERKILPTPVIILLAVMGAVFISFVAYRLHRAAKTRITQIPTPVFRDGAVSFNPQNVTSGSWANPQVRGLGGTVILTECEFVPPPSYNEISHRDTPKVPTYEEAMTGRERGAE